MTSRKPSGKATIETAGFNRGALVVERTNRKTNFNSYCAKRTALI